MPNGIDEIYNFAEDNFSRKQAEGPQNQRLPRLFWVFREPVFLLFYHLLLPYTSCNSSHQFFSCLVCILFSIIKRWMANTQSYDWGGWLVPNAVSCVRLFVVIWLSLCLEIHNWFVVIVFEMSSMWFINSNLDWVIGLSLSLTTVYPIPMVHSEWWGCVFLWLQLLFTFVVIGGPWTALSLFHPILHR